MSLNRLVGVSLLSMVLGGCAFSGGRDISDGEPGAPSRPDAGSSERPDAASTEEPEALTCDAIDSELELNCDIERPCADFSTEEHGCIEDVMAIDWARPPCEEYAACLDIPLASCPDTDAELSTNCGIDQPCNQMEWGERFCLSELMALDWATPPCDLYAECLDLSLFACDDIEAELSTNCQMDVTCNQLAFEERLCLSDLMSQLWGDPPCDQYQGCVE